MHTKVSVLFVLFSVVWSHDITVGSNTKGRKIFDETREASPAIWRQIENVTIIAPNDELISGVVITDMRPDKDGDVKVVDGGEGKDSVTIELKSPTVLRGYEFHIEIFSVPETMFTDAEEHLFTGDEVASQKIDITTELPESSTGKEVPAVVAEEVNSENIRPARETEDKSIPLAVSFDGITTTVPDQTSTTSEKINLALSLDQDETSENNKIDETTTEIGNTVMSASEAITTAPITFDQNKNFPDYNSLSILDYIKSRESTRNIRHTEDSSKSLNIEVTEKSVLSNSEEPTSTTRQDDDTADLVPPSVGAMYNDDFSEIEKGVETSTLYINKPRAGRGLTIDSKTNNEEDSTPIPSTTEFATTLNSEDNTTDVTMIDYEQSRNIRDIKKDSHEGSYAEDFPKNTDAPNEETTFSTKVTGESTDNVIVINREQLGLPLDDNQIKLALPIVLIIGSENNFPVIKIIAEDMTNVPKNKFLWYATRPTDESLNEKPIKPSDDYMPSGDYGPKL